jgi:hypothetical protein
MPYEGIDIAISGVVMEEYVDLEGGTSERWVAGMDIGSEQHPRALPRPIRAGQVIEFEGYRIRILDIRENEVDFAISRLNGPPPEATATLSIYNTELGEARHFVDQGSESRYGSLRYVFSEPRVEEVVDESGVVIEETVVSVRIWTDQSQEELNTTMRIGDIIEFEGYRIRLLWIYDDVTVFVALADLSELSIAPGGQAP